MTIDELVHDAYLRSTGKAQTLTAGSKRARIVALANYYQRRWGRTRDVDWNSLYDPFISLGAVTATDTFPLLDTIKSLSKREGDVIRIVWSDGTTYTDYTLVNHDKLKDYSAGVNKQSPFGNYAAQIGRNLVFNRTFTADDPQFGGTIYVPGYGYPNPIDDTNPSVDTVQVDDPDWLVARVAAEYVRNDVTRRQRWTELLAEANEIWERMIDDNEGQIDEVDRPWTPFTGDYDNAWS